MCTWVWVYACTYVWIYLYLLTLTHWVCFTLKYIKVVMNLSIYIYFLIDLMQYYWVHQLVVCEQSLTPDMGDCCYEQLHFWTDSAITFHQLLSSTLKLEIIFNQSHVCACVFLPRHSAAFCHHGWAAGSGVSKCGAALLPPNQGRVSLQPQPRTSVEQQRLDWDFWGTHSRVAHTKGSRVLHLQI